MSVEARPHGGAPERLTPAPPAGNLIDSPRFPIAAKREIKNHQKRINLQHATTTIRKKRRLVVSEMNNWEDLRFAGSQIKDRAARHLDQYLEQFEQNFTRNGGHVHWARDAEEANRIVIDLVKQSGEKEVVKVKSMVSQEIDMNEALEEQRIAAWETDLAELIVQLGHDRPSHVLVPAIHRNRAEIREIFLEEMARYGTPPPADLDDNPKNLAAAARRHLREKFMRIKTSTSGANFVVAETGSLVVMESEGNGRMCLTLPETLISVVGIEKIVPTFQDLEVFLQLLPRSSTGERMAPYVSCWTGAREGDGPKNVHVVLVDNGRTNVLKDPVGREALRCIRCSACMNICPVYERVSGHAYGSVYPGPIGAILNPQLRGTDSAIDRSLPFASSLCGACNEVCPVKIPISDILVHERNKVVEAKKADPPHLPNTPEPYLMSVASWVMNDHRNLALAGKASSLGGKVLGQIFGWQKIGPLPPPLSRWTNARDVPMVPAQSFRQWWKKNRGDQK